MILSTFESSTTSTWPAILQRKRKMFCEYRYCCSSDTLSKTMFSLRHKRRIAEYLLSHVMSCGLPTVKLFLVALLDRVSDQAKAEALLPTVQYLMDKERASDWEELFGPQFEEFATITVSALDSSISGHLNDTSGTFWPIFLDTIRFYFQPGK